jgi:hypothetical protein
MNRGSSAIGVTSTLSNSYTTALEIFQHLGAAKDLERKLEEKKLA